MENQSTTFQQLLTPYSILQQQEDANKFEIAIQYANEAIQIDISPQENLTTLFYKLHTIFQIQPSLPLLLTEKFTSRQVNSVQEIKKNSKYCLWVADSSESQHQPSQHQFVVTDSTNFQRIKPSVFSLDEQSSFYHCPFYNCQKQFKQSGNLKTHIRSHTGERPYQCSFVGCDMSFITKGHLKTHMYNHRIEKPFVCKICKRGYSQKSRLEIHIRKHQGIKPFACDVCGKRFTENGNLKVHKRSHNGERKHECGYCNQKFITKGHLDDHKKRHENLRPFKCNECGTQFYRSTQLKNHQSKPQTCMIKQQQKDIQSNYSESRYEEQKMEVTKKFDENDQKLAAILGIKKYENQIQQPHHSCIQQFQIPQQTYIIQPQPQQQCYAQNFNQIPTQNSTLHNQYFVLPLQNDKNQYFQGKTSLNQNMISPQIQAFDPIQMQQPQIFTFKQPEPILQYGVPCSSPFQSPSPMHVHCFQSTIPQQFSLPPQNHNF